MKENESAKCGGTERWDVKVLTDTNASQVNYNPVLTTIDSLVHIVTPLPSTTAPRFTGLEYKTYKIRCQITRKKSESDSDYHIVVSDGTYTMITEIPDPVCAVASTSAHVNEYIAARQFIATYIPLTPDYNVNLPDVAISGVLFLDPPHGQTGEALNHIEFHPILDIHFWSDSDAIEIKPSPVLTVDLSPSIFSTSTHLTLKSKNPILGKCRFELYSSDGLKVKEFILPVTYNNGIDYTIQRNKLASGIYIYRIINNDSLLYDGKLVIE